MISASIGAFQLTLVGVKNTAWYYYAVKMNLEINGNCVFWGKWQIWNVYQCGNSQLVEDNEVTGMKRCENQIRGQSI